MELWRKELYHHGIKGQKWGQRNGPPYPLDPSKRSVREQKANTKKKKQRGPKVETSSKTFDVDYIFDKKKGEYVKQKTKWESTEHKISNTNAKASKNVDRYAEEEDYYEAYFNFDDIGSEAVRAYNKEGLDAALKILQQKLGDVSYEYILTEEKELVGDGERYAVYDLKVYGDKYVYRTAGDEDYSDDQYFYKK